MNAQELTETLERLGACVSAVRWSAGKTFEEAWTTCQRGDWMLWLAKRQLNQSGWCNLQNLTLAKVRCAGLVKHLMRDQRSLDALAVAERFAFGSASLLDLKAAAADAAAAYAAAAYAEAAYAAAYVAAVAADVAVAVDAAAAAAEAKTETRIKTLSLCADICRDIIVTPLNVHKPQTPQMC